MNFGSRVVFCLLVALHNLLNTLFYAFFFKFGLMVHWLQCYLLPLGCKVLFLAHPPKLGTCKIISLACHIELLFLLIKKILNLVFMIMSQDHAS